MSLCGESDLNAKVMTSFVFRSKCILPKSFVAFLFALHASRQQNEVIELVHNGTLSHIVTSSLRSSEGRVFSTQGVG